MERCLELKRDSISFLLAISGKGGCIFYRESSEGTGWLEQLRRVVWAAKHNQQMLSLIHI